MPPFHRSLRWLSTAVLFLLQFVGVGPIAAYAPLVPRVADPQAPGDAVETFAGTTFYVSRRGNNADGRSWTTAWNELNRINWSSVQPGDTIVLDGGNDTMVYTTTLSVGKSGVQGKSITIRLSDESGRNGRVIIFGGRSMPLPYCAQDSSYILPTTNTRSLGINIGDADWIVIDGKKWRGLTVYGHNGDGVRVGAGASNVTLRNLEIYDNGTAAFEGGVWMSHSAGIRLRGSNITVERAIIHDNGQDGIQSAGMSNLIVRQSWLYHGRTAPDGSSWAYCRHPDGIQVYAGGEQYGLTVKESVVGPGFMQGLILGEPGDDVLANMATVHNVLVQDTLFYGTGNSAILNHSSAQVPPKNWIIERITSDRKHDDDWTQLNIQTNAGELTVRDSIFSGGYSFSVPSSGNYTGNCQYNVPRGTRIGSVTTNPYASSSTLGTWSTSANFGVISGLHCHGSRITSSSQLLSTTLALTAPNEGLFTSVVYLPMTVR